LAAASQLVPTLQLAIGFVLLAYLCGSMSFSVWITRWVKGVDLRESGSGHATTTNTIRQAGFGPAALVLVLEVAKGFLPVWLAMKVAPVLWIVPLTAASVVIGHCWPLFAQFRGGMGLTAAGGSLLAAGPLPFLVAAAVLILLTLILHHGARASVTTGITGAPIFWLLGLRGIEFWIALAAGLVIAYRFAQDWRRKYRELWLDRERT
jgi:glycerol-3-phosphate acyltransferase PlsY